nr:homeobox-containing protein 1 isoform X2 [Ciona intestinalis]|eukprot:XP_002121071.1 homeobox-containing protein 1 isoform X2 [Ciona intestinalis]
MRDTRLSPHPEEMGEPDPPKFTVNQILLLQKLKQSGLTKSQIIKGLDEMERFDDVGLGSPGASVSSSTQQVPNGNSPSSVGSTNSGNTVTSCANAGARRNSTSPQSPHLPVKTNTVIPHPQPIPNHLMFGAHMQNASQLSLIPPVAAWPNTSQAVAVATAASILQNGFAHGNVPHSVYPSLINGRGLLQRGPAMSGTGSTVVEVDGEKIDITEELEDLFRRDQASVKEDIRKFISERHISQSAIAKATRNAISQSYISQWLAQPQDISGQKKKAMYTWYIVERRKPPGLTNGMSSVPPVVFRHNEIENDCISPMMMKSKRGARFTWPKECLSILENYYNANSYPDECKREEIAHACNAIIQSQKPGSMLTELDKVTTVKVYNWFANRRKDDKRRRHIEHVEAMDQHHLIMSPRRNSATSPSPSCHSNDSSQGVESNERNYSSFPLPIPPQCMVIPKKENPMQLALEMAAVNHSIMALVNPHQVDDPMREDEEDDLGESSSEEIQRPEERRPFERLPDNRSYAG